MATHEPRGEQSVDEVHQQPSVRPGDLGELRGTVREAMLRSILPPEVVVVEAEEWMWSAPLLDEEAACVRTALPTRQREFSAGRTCARLALARLGITGYPLRTGPRRAPAWPPGIVGSITHTDGYCAAAVCRSGRIRSVGVDAETKPVAGDRLEQMVCSLGESRAFPDRPPTQRMRWTQVAFSAKESIFKSYFPLTGHFLDFHDVEVTVDPAGAFEGRLVNPAAPAAAGQRRFTGRYVVAGSCVVTAVVVWSGGACAT